MFKILIVEDSADYRQTLKALLKQRFPSSAVNEAEDGKRAIKELNDFFPDLIFMDIRLPGENGLELTKTIKGLYPEKTIIILNSSLSIQKFFFNKFSYRLFHNTSLII